MPGPAASSAAPPPRPVRVGVLAVQGDYAAHVSALRRICACMLWHRPQRQLAAARLGLRQEPRDHPRLPVRAELQGVDGLIIPGGESTTFLKFLERDGFLDALQAFAVGRPTFGTCAGAILLAGEVLHPPQPSLGALDATVERNAYGRQNDSAILHADTELGGPPLEMVFIRAPRFGQVGADVRVLARRDGLPTLVEQGHVLAATFHPELSEDTRVHRYFLEKVRAHVAGMASAEPRGQKY